MDSIRQSVDQMIAEQEKLNRASTRQTAVDLEVKLMAEFEALRAASNVATQRNDRAEMARLSSEIEGVTNSIFNLQKHK